MKRDTTADVLQLGRMFRLVSDVEAQRFEWHIVKNLSWYGGGVQVVTDRSSYDLSRDERIEVRR